MERIETEETPAAPAAESSVVGAYPGYVVTDGDGRRNGYRRLTVTPEGAPHRAEHLEYRTSAISYNFASLVRQLIASIERKDGGNGNGNGNGSVNGNGTH